VVEESPRELFRRTRERSVRKDLSVKQSPGHSRIFDIDHES